MSQGNLAGPSQMNLEDSNSPESEYIEFDIIKFFLIEYPSFNNSKLRTIEGVNRSEPSTHTRPQSFPLTFLKLNLRPTTSTPTVYKT